MSFKPRIIEGGKGSNFPCTFCAQGFSTRDALNKHWESDPRCKNNRMVSNPLQSKYGMAGGIENIPGEPTLLKIRQPGCEHPIQMREALYPDNTGQSPQIGYRCGYCYTEVYG